MSAFIADDRSCHDCYGSGIRNTDWAGTAFKNGPVICSNCWGTGERFTDLGCDLAAFLETWEKRKKPAAKNETV